MPNKGSTLSANLLCSALLVAGFATASSALAADSVGEPGRSASGKNPLKNVYFGEQHMHTRNSFDAFTIGVKLSGAWTDPDFDPTNSAAYYVRVLEIPTPRWSTYDSVKTGISVPEGIPATLQERAWSSPVWYRPEATKTAAK